MAKVREDHVTIAREMVAREMQVRRVAAQPGWMSPPCGIIWRGRRPRRMGAGIVRRRC